MCKRHKRFVIFLDVDGVLNTTTTVQKTPDGYTGIDDARVEVLAKTIEKIGGADLVLSSDWKEMKPTDDDYVYLISKLALCLFDSIGEQQMFPEFSVLLKVKSAVIQNYILFNLRMCFQVFQNPFSPFVHLILCLPIDRQPAQFASETPAVEAIVFRDYLKLF